MTFKYKKNSQQKQNTEASGDDSKSPELLKTFVRLSDLIMLLHRNVIAVCAASTPLRCV